MGSKVGNILKAAAPLALSYFAPGLGSAIGGSLLGAGAAGSSTLGSALLGGALSGLTGGNPITGAITGGLGANIGNFASGLQGPMMDGSSLGSGSGILGAIGDATGITGSGLSSLGSGITGGGASSFGGGGNILSNVLSAGLGSSANEDAEEALLNAQNRALGAITPFQNTSFNPEDLASDPGYQFQLAEGEKALARNQAARGNYFSGSAMKAAQDYGQGLASTTFDAANNRFNNNRNFNYGVAQDQAGIFGNQGNIEANSGVNQSNLLSGALSGIMDGNGISNTGQQLNKTILGYDPKTGQPIYG